MDTKLQIKLVFIYNTNYSTKYLVKLNTPKRLKWCYSRPLEVAMFGIPHNMKVLELSLVVIGVMESLF